MKIPLEQKAHLYTLAGVCALPRAYLRTGNFPRASIWRLCRNKGLHPLRRFAAIPAHPQKQYTRRWLLYYFCGFYYPIREVIPIAIYHWNVGIVSRGKGKLAVTAAAYRSTPLRSWIVPRLRNRRRLSVPDTIWTLFRRIWQLTARTQRHC